MHSPEECRRRATLLDRCASIASNRFPPRRSAEVEQAFRSPPRIAMLTVALVPLLSGCMTGGLANTGVMGQPGPAGSLQHAEASAGDLTITLSFPATLSGAAVRLEAWLASDNESTRLTNGEVWLRIRTPTGRVDQFPMRRIDSSATAYQATYSFQVQGPYLVTAEGRTGTGAYLRTVTVTAPVEVGPARLESHRHWMMPMAVLGGLGMIVMMAAMVWH